MLETKDLLRCVDNDRSDGLSYYWVYRLRRNLLRRNYIKIFFDLNKIGDSNEK